MDFILGVFFFLCICVYGLATSDQSGGSSHSHKRKTFSEMQEERRKNRALREEVERALRNR